jgi:two-component system copper resistance phosphate regulon response regulator CusR
MTAQPKRILVVEDEESIRDFLSIGLKEKGFEVDTAVDGEEGLAKAEADRGRYAVYVLDIMLPKLDGKEMVVRLREQGDATPVLFLTALDRVEDRISGLELGADDYLVKPFAFEELTARIRALIRRAKSETDLTVRVGELFVDRVERKVVYAGRPVELTQREYQLLDYFLRHQGVVLSRDQISRDVWGLSYTGESNFVDVYVRHLRQKIWDKEDSQIQTVRGRGYVLADQEAKEAEAEE